MDRPRLNRKGQTLVGRTDQKGSDPCWSHPAMLSAMNKATRGSVAVFVAAFLLLGTGCGEAPIPSTPERTARGVVQALQDKDVHAYLSLCSNRADLVELMEGADLSEADEEKARGKLDRWCSFAK